MEVRGKIIKKLDPQSGMSKAGNQWKKQEYVLETLDNFPRKICFDFFGERADQYPLEVGDMVNLSFDIESREYQGRWYTSIRGWKAEKVDPNAPAAGSMAPPAADPGMPQTAAPAPVSEVPNFSEPQDGDDLPF